MRWLIDRSRIEEQHFCPTARYLRYHSGEHSFGIDRKSASVPLSTGSFVHEGLALILQGVKPLEASERAQQGYLEHIKKRGFFEEDAPELVNEQSHLLACLILGWAKSVLPVFLKEFEIISVEEEISIPLPALGDVELMVRPDVVARNRASKKRSSHDFKTTAYMNEEFENSWHTAIQMAIQVAAVREKYGECEEFYIHGLAKGVRKNAYNTLTREYDGPKQQQSVLCYAWHTDGNPPFSPEEWSFDTSRKKGWDKVPVWEHRTPAEHIKWIEKENQLGKFFSFLGPYHLPEERGGQLFRSLVGSESAWLGTIRDVEEKRGERSWVEFWSQEQELLDVLIPRSYSDGCRKYGKPCPFRPLCFKETGWDNPIGSGVFVNRTPHHTPELEQMLSLGIEVEKAVDTEGGEE